jgi:hypothetical protein
MDEQQLQQLATLIAEQVKSNMEISTAIIGLLGVIIGASIPVIGNILLHKYQKQKQDRIDQVRKSLLQDMLNDGSFKDGRSLETLSKVTGAEPEECRRLLIEIEARGFTMADKREGWTYIKNRPLSEK